MRRFLSASVLLILFLSCNPRVVKKESLPAQTAGHFPALYVIKEQVNMRSAPAAQSSKVAVLEDGAELQVEKNKNGWYKIITDDGKNGWLRSDLAGPRNLSLTRMASAFTDSILPAFKAEMFFDKTDLYKTIYLTLRDDFYSSQKRVRREAQKIGRAYQQKVYHGALEIRVLHPQNKELFLRLKMPAAGLAKIPLPILKYGVLISLHEKNKAVSLFIAVPDSISDKQLLRAARKISARYDYPFTKTEIYMVSATPAGLKYLAHFKNKPADKTLCRLYYLEDADGEDYRFRFCGK